MGTSKKQINVRCSVKMTVDQFILVSEDNYVKLQDRLSQDDSISEYYKDDKGQIKYDPLYSLLSESLDFSDPFNWEFEDVELLEEEEERSKL